jgi:glycopeptide antibiotics resistance protein
MIKRFTRFSIWPTTKTMVAVYFLAALVFVIPFGLLMSVVPTAAGESKPGFLMLLAMPFVYAIVALIFVPIGCLIYNVCAKMTGGVEVTVETTEG